ncbi:hypothetical protein [Saccharopolyspora gloriosae]|uniref:hypothetical protein n=1 Tax=Saccharopolyspora gloriosae TaxID=455344 RepID=UPI001FB81CA3|nr:hypothetical protein [Saccharopolyspora gloriosae]
MSRWGWIGIAATALLVSTAPQAAAATWADEPLPERDTSAALTSAASGDGATWAFGSWSTSMPQQHSIAYLRDQHGWTEVPTPDIGRLDDAVVVSADDVWAIGADAKYGFGSSLHWDGAQWTEAGFTAPGNRNGARGIEALGTDDVWAVGSSYDDEAGTGRGLAQHWDGSAWRDVPVPQRAGNWTFSDVTGSAPDDVWAVGNDGGYPAQGLAMHWNGQAWTEVPVPDVELGELRAVQLTEAQSLAADDVWATGNVHDSSGDTTTFEPLLLHWDGQTWSYVDAPRDAGARQDLVRAGDELWSLGERLLHFDGTGWRQQDGPPAGAAVGGTELADGRLLTVGSSGGYPDVNPFVSVRQN